MNTPLIEACVDSYASCRAAYRGGADRLELCAHLVIGGTTPSTALFRQVQRDIPVKTNILIRPRFGDFLYSKEELEQMCEEIRTYRELGANGVVIGALTPDGDLDLAADELRGQYGRDAAPRVRYDARPVCGHGGRHPSGL